MAREHRYIDEMILGDSDRLELEHRCYNGVSLAAAIGCLSAVIFNSILGISLPHTVITFIVSLTYLWLYFRGRFSVTYTPVLWLYILNGAVLLVATWFFNGGINGSDISVSMVALVAMIVVMKTRRWRVVAVVFVPLMTVLFIAEYHFPDWVVAYGSRGQRFMDLYLSFVVSTVVIFAIIVLILKSYNQERARAAEANRLLEDKIAALNRANADLEDALARVKRLSGMLPICASCKNIRDDQGYWRQVEAYIERHSEASFSHGICPECAKKHYPELEIYQKE